MKREVYPFRNLSLHNKKSFNGSFQRSHLIYVPQRSEGFNGLKVNINTQGGFS